MFRIRVVAFESVPLTLQHGDDGVARLLDGPVKLRCLLSNFLYCSFFPFGMFVVATGKTFAKSMVKTSMELIHSVLLFDQNHPREYLCTQQELYILPGSVLSCVVLVIERGRCLI